MRAPLPNSDARASRIGEANGYGRGCGCAGRSRAVRGCGLCREAGGSRTGSKRRPPARGWFQNASQSEYKVTGSREHPQPRTAPDRPDPYTAHKGPSARSAGFRHGDVTPSVDHSARTNQRRVQRRLRRKLSRIQAEHESRNLALEMTPGGAQFSTDCGHRA